MAEQPWRAYWIGPANDPREEIGVFRYRCVFLWDQTSEFRIRFSADQRCKLFVNGRPVAQGPPRGDLRHWFSQDLDLAEFLQPGENVVEALVWNFGRFAPMAQHSARTAFVFEALGQNGSPLDTPGEWEVAPLPFWGFGMFHSHDAEHYIDVGPGERVDANWGAERVAPTRAPEAEGARTLRRLLERIAAILDAKKVVIMLHDPATDELAGVPPAFGVDERHLARMRLAADQGIAGQVYQDGRSILLGPQETKMAPYALLRVRHGVAVPLVFETDEPPSEQIIGVLQAFDAAGGSGFDLDHAELLEGMGRNLGGILGSMQAYGEALFGAQDTLRSLEWFTGGPRTDMELGDDGLDWRKPHVIAPAEARGTGYGGTPWMLIPTNLPPMLYDLRDRLPLVRTWSSEDRLALPLTLDGAGLSALLDYGELLCAYPRLRARALGADQPVTLTLTYAEALWNLDGTKGNRGDIAGKTMKGVQDRFVVGRDAASFEPLWWRTFRYVQVEADTPVQIEAIDAIETGYPLEVSSSFEADDPWVERMWEVGLRTLRRCMGETYFDCPYWEQLQYLGDTRIQALLSTYLGANDPIRNAAIEAFAWSQIDGGLVQSRYPSRQTQIIPTFVPFWAMMVRDAALYARGAPAPWAEVGVALDAAERAISEGSFWQFVDWVPGWRAGVPNLGHTTIASLLLDLARAQAGLRSAGESLGQYRLRDGLVAHCDDEEWGPSEHAEALFRLLQGEAGAQSDPWPTEALASAAAPECTYYFSYYKHQAMRPTDYMALLGPWKAMIEDGLTTFAENPEPTRSDCHAWSAHPVLGFFQIVAGVTSLASGWAKARIEPRPGSLERFSARIAHPDGPLRVEHVGGRLTVECPVPFTLVWQGKEATLVAGRHEF